MLLSVQDRQQRIDETRGEIEEGRYCRVPTCTYVDENRMLFFSKYFYEIGYSIVAAYLCFTHRHTQDLRSSRRGYIGANTKPADICLVVMT